MKAIVIAALFSLCLIACSKYRADNSPFRLEGKWRFVSSFMGTGGPTVTVPAERKTDFVEFKANGEFFSNVQGFNQYYAYEIVDSIKLILKSKGVVVQNKPYRYWYNHSNKIFTLSQMEPMCIEGCGDNFKRW
jgi:hypothetical protein